MYRLLYPHSGTIVADDYFSMTFSLAAGYEFKPSRVSEDKIYFYAMYKNTDIVLCVIPIGNAEKIS